MWSSTTPIAGAGPAIAANAALSWRAWGVPTVDAGHELNVASSLASGAQPYGDIRYFYGPVGVYALGVTVADTQDGQDWSLS